MDVVAECLNVAEDRGTTSGPDWEVYKVYGTLVIIHYSPPQPVQDTFTVPQSHTPL